MLAIRPATVADISAIARVDVETWRATYAGILPDHLLVGLSERQRTAVWMRFISRRPGDALAAFDDAGNAVGFGSCGIQRDPDLCYAGEVFTLYVAPDFQGQDLGRLLLLGLFARLVRCGHYSALVWVLAENPARFFYERLGGKAVRHRQITMDGTKVDAIAYGWSDLPEAIRSRGRARSRTG